MRIQRIETVEPWDRKQPSSYRRPVWNDCAYKTSHPLDTCDPSRTITMKLCNESVDWLSRKVGLHFAAAAPLAIKHPQFGDNLKMAKKIRAADAKEVGVGNPAEETYRYPNQIFVGKLEPRRILSII